MERRDQMRVVVAAILGSCALLFNMAAAGAAGDGTNTPTPVGTVVNGTPEAIVVVGPTGVLHEIDHPGAGRSGTWTCHYYRTTAEVQPTDIEIDATTPIVPTAGQVVGLECWDDSGALAHSAIFVFDPADPVPGIDDPAQAAANAVKQLRLDAPTIGLSPPVGVVQLVGVSTWLWIADPWRPAHASATLEGVTSTVTATPVSVTWQLGDGTTMTCAGPGTPYDPGRSADEQHSDCSMLFEVAGSYALTGTVTYRTSWVATTGETGALAAVTRTSTVPVVVEEAQALIH
jgi:hypothetical protein